MKLPDLAEMVGEFTIVRLPALSPWPAWTKDSAFVTVTKTTEELSIVCESQCVPATVERAERGWRALAAVGPLDFSLTGILAAMAAPLAEARISIFAISTFDTDYVLVRRSDLEAAKRVLVDAGFQFC